MTTPFDEGEAAERLGFPGQRFDSISPYMLDGVYWVRISSGEKRFGGPVIVDQGHLLTEKGYAVGMAWLRRLSALEKPTAADTTDVQFALATLPLVLMQYDALPLGWHEREATGFDPQSNERGSIKLRPIEIKLISWDYISPRSRRPRADGLPSGRPPIDMPDGRPAGGPSTSPSAGGPSAGPSARRPSRATLREIDGKLTWILETYDASTTTWREELRDQAED